LRQGEAPFSYEAGRRHYAADSAAPSRVTVIAARRRSVIGLSISHDGIGGFAAARRHQSSPSVSSESAADNIISSKYFGRTKKQWLLQSRFRALITSLRRRLPGIRALRFSAVRQ